MDLTIQVISSANARARAYVQPISKAALIRESRPACITANRAAGVSRRGVSEWNIPYTWSRLAREPQLSGFTVRAPAYRSCIGSRAENQLEPRNTVAIVTVQSTSHLDSVEDSRLFVTRTSGASNGIVPPHSRRYRRRKFCYASPVTF